MLLAMANPPDILQSDLLLQRVPDLKVLIESNSHVAIQRGGVEFRTGSHGLAVLAAFGQPCTCREVIQNLGSTTVGLVDCQDLVSTIRCLYDAGVLVSIESEELRAEIPLDYDGAEIHISMLNDQLRTSGFLAAIRQTVTPQDVVLEIGTGTGVLAVGAAQAGARHVYAVEAGGARILAEALVAGSGIADRITVIPGWSTRISLPERASVFVSEVIGNEPLEENILEITLDARARLMQPGARQIPASIEIWLWPVCMPPSEQNRRQFSPELTQEWSSLYGIDFSPLVKSLPPRAARFYTSPHYTSTWPALCEPVRVFQVDLSTFTSAIISVVAEIVVRQSGAINGLMTFFKSELSPGNILSTHPDEADPDNHWLNRVQILPLPLAVQEGDRLRVSYDYQNGASAASVTIC